jgi:hypothetical protein
VGLEEGHCGINSIDAAEASALRIVRRQAIASCWCSQFLSSLVFAL